MTRPLLLPTIAITLLTRLEAGQVQVDMISGPNTNPSLFDQNTAASNALSGGTAANGDGFVLQLGYYDQATATGNNFLGNWVPLTGEGSANTGTNISSSPGLLFNKTTIGDVSAEGAGNGSFAMSLTFISGSAQGNSLPPSTAIPLAVRFYNGFTISGSTHYNVVSSDSWIWKDINGDPPPMPIDVSLTGSLEWLSIALGQNANTAFHTTVLVPEPGVTLLTAAGLASLTARRRALRKVESDRNLS